MSRSRRTGITLVEVLVVIAVIAVMIAMLVPARRRVRESASRVACMDNLRQIIMAFHAYQNIARPAPDSASPSLKWFPPGCIGPGNAPQERLSWAVALLPYLDENALYRQINLEVGYSDNKAAVEKVAPVFCCPEAKRSNAANYYVALAGLGKEAAARAAGAIGNGFMGYDRLTSMATIADGTANTIALMEISSGIGSWAMGGPSTLRGITSTDLPLTGNHANTGKSGTNVAMADASVRFLDASVEFRVLSAAITIDAGEQIPLD